MNISSRPRSSAPRAASSPLHTVRRALAALALISVTACDDGGGIVVNATPNCTVSALRIVPGSVTVAAGETSTLQAALTSANCTTPPAVTWTSGTPTIASVDIQGNVTALVPGTTTITASALGTNGTATVTVTEPAVATVSVVLDDASLLPGSRTAAAATARAANGTVLTGRAITWSSANSGIAVVNTEGDVTAIAPGTTAISATIEGRSGSATLTVQPFPVASVSLTVANGTMRPGQQQTAIAAARGANGAVLSDRSIAWTSSNPAVASVSASGLITALAVGTTAISAASEGQFAVAALTVSPGASSVDLALARTTVTAGEQTQAAAVVRDVTGAVLPNEPVTFASSNAAIATVSSTGLVTSTAPGTVNILASSGGVASSAALTVNPVGVPIASILFTPASATVLVGATRQLAAVARDAQNNPLTGRTIGFSSSAPQVAAVSLDGTVTAVAPGTATITARAEGITATATITVSPVPIAIVQVTTPSSTMNLGNTLQLSTTVRDANDAIVTGATCTFATSNGAVAAVSGTGTVTAVSVGEASISATCSGVTGSVTVFVVGSPTLSVVATQPASGATDLSIESTFQVTFSEALNPTTVNSTTVVLRRGTATVAATRTVNGSSITVTPISLLTEFNSEYTLHITAGLQSAAGNTLPSPSALTYTTWFWDPAFVYRVRNRSAGDGASLDVFPDTKQVFMGTTGGFTSQFWFFARFFDGQFSMQNLLGGADMGLEAADTGTRPFLTNGGLPDRVDFGGMLWRAVPIDGNDYLLRPSSAASKSLATPGDVPQMVTTPDTIGANSSFRWYFTREFKR